MSTVIVTRVNLLDIAFWMQARLAQNKNHRRMQGAHVGPKLIILFMMFTHDVQMCIFIMFNYFVPDIGTLKGHTIVRRYYSTSLFLTVPKYSLILLCESLMHMN